MWLPILIQREFSGNSFYVTPWRATVLVVLCIYLTGCSTYNLAALPGGSYEQQGKSDQPPLVFKGATVRVTLFSGEKFVGEVWSVSKDSILLKTFILSDEFDSKQVTILSEDIEKIEMDSGSSIAGFVSVAVGLALIGMLVSFRVSTDNN